MSDEYCAAISRKSGPKPGCKARYRSTLLLRRRRARVSVGEYRGVWVDAGWRSGVCCVLWDEGLDSGSKIQISQHSRRNAWGSWGWR